MGTQSVALTNPLRRVDRRIKVLQQATLLLRLPVDLDLVLVRLLDDQSVEVAQLVVLRCRRSLQVLLLDSTRQRVFVAEDEVDLVGRSASVWAEHDGVRGLVRQLLRLDALRGDSKLEEGIEMVSQSNRVVKGRHRRRCGVEFTSGLSVSSFR